MAQRRGVRQWQPHRRIGREGPTREALLMRRTLLVLRHVDEEGFVFERRRGFLLLLRCVAGEASGEKRP